MVGTIFPCQPRTGDKGSVERDAEPTAKFCRVTDGLPHPGQSAFQEDFLLNAIGDHMQPLGCISYSIVAALTCNGVPCKDALRTA